MYNNDYLMNIAMRTVLKNTHDFMFVKNKDFRYIEASESFALDCAGLEKVDELIGKTDYEIFKDQSLAEKYRKDDKTIFESKMPMLEYRESYPDKMGRKRYCLTTKYIILDDNGEPAGIFGRCHDITEQVELEQTGKEQQLLIDKQKNIFKSLKDIYKDILFLDLQKKTYHFITGLENMSKRVSPSGAMDDLFSEWMLYNVANESKEVCKEFFDISNMQKTIKQNGILTKEIESTNLGWLRVSVVPVEYGENNDVITALWVEESIDEEKRKEIKQHQALQSAYETAKRANSAKTEFLSRVSHDIRTPMNAIVGMAEIASAYPDDRDKVQECLRKITFSSAHLLTLINEVLDMSKIESGNIEKNEEKFNILELLESVIAITNPLVIQKQHRLYVDSTGICHKNVIGDRLHIQQIFTNILSNAIKYTPDGGTLQITARELKCHQPLLTTYEFSFKDNGIGMTEEYIKHIYEPFSREEDSRTSKVAGTGLGMSIVMNIIKMLGGQINIESQKGIGSNFTVTLHLKTQDNVSLSDNSQNNVSQLKIKQSTISDNKSLERKYTDKRILVVEDQEINRDIAATFLDMAGIMVEEAQDGLQALNMVEKSEEGYYDMIFMDVQMPVMNGYDATRSIRKLNRHDIKKMPIIAMTANAFVSDVNDAKSAGMNDHIAKPVDLEKFNSVLAKWFGNE